MITQLSVTRFKDKKKRRVINNQACKTGSAIRLMTLYMGSFIARGTVSEGRLGCDFVSGAADSRAFSCTSRINNEQSTHKEDV